MNIEERVETLEREARHNRKVIRWLGVFLGLCIGAWLATGVFLPQGLVAQDVAEEIRANRFVVVDEEGRDRIVLLMRDHQIQPILPEDPIEIEQHPGLLLFGENENIQVVLGANKYGGGLAIADEEGNVLIELQGYLNRSHLQLPTGITPEGIEEFYIPYVKKSLIRLSSSWAMGSRISMMDEEGRDRIILDSGFVGVPGHSGKPKLALIDNEGYYAWRTPPTE